MLVSFTARFSQKTCEKTSHMWKKGLSGLTWT